MPNLRNLFMNPLRKYTTSNLYENIATEFSDF